MKPFLAILLSLSGWAGLGAQENDSSFSLGFVCLGKEVATSEDACEKAFRSAFHLEKDEPLEIEIEKKDQKISISVGFADGKSVIAVEAGFAVPWEEVEYACMNSYFWPTAAKELKKSQNHFIVFVTNTETENFQRALHLSRGLLAVAHATNALGIFNGDAATVYSPAYYDKMLPKEIKEAGDVPAILWIGFLKSGHRDETLSLYTRGLTEFGCKELEVVKSKKKGMEIFELLHGITQYLVFAGDVIEDGHTVGGTEEEKIKVRLKKSQIDREEKVLRVGF